MTRKPVRSKIGEGRPIAVVGDVYRLLATSEETDGKYALIEAIVPPGGGPPPHKHSREEEGFYVLEGELRITVDGESFVARPGEFVNLPVGSLHWFANATDKPAKMLITLSPAGLERCSWRLAVPFLPAPRPPHLPLWKSSHNSPPWPHATESPWLCRSADGKNFQNSVIPYGTLCLTLSSHPMHEHGLPPILRAPDVRDFLEETQVSCDRELGQMGRACALPKGNTACCRDCA